MVSFCNIVVSRFVVLFSVSVSISSSTDAEELELGTLRVVFQVPSETLESKSIF